MAIPIKNPSGIFLGKEVGTLFPNETFFGQFIEWLTDMRIIQSEFQSESIGLCLLMVKKVFQNKARKDSAFVSKALPYSNRPINILYCLIQSLSWKPHIPSVAMHLGSYNPNNEEFSMSPNILTLIWAFSFFSPMPFQLEIEKSVTAGIYRLYASPVPHKY